MRLPDQLQHPARVVPAVFASLALIGTLLLSLPVMTESGDRPPLLVAVFTSTSAITVTGLTVVDTSTYWSGAGHVVIMLLMQVGGFGIMALATLLALGVSRRLGLRTRLLAQAETRVLGLGDLNRLVRHIATTILTVEAVVAVVLAWRLTIDYQDPLRGIWYGIFHAVSAVNNGGFVLWEGGTGDYGDDPVVLLVIALGTIAGSIGFPVLLELRREFRRPGTWSVHTQLTVWASSALLLIGTVSLLALEWGNPATFGRFSPLDKLVHAFFASAQPRSGGFSAVDLDQMRDESLLVIDGLMFIGGGSAGTSGGIKVTTFALLLFVIWAEVRGHRDVVVGRRRVSTDAQRLALSIALLGVAIVGLGTFALVSVADGAVDRLMFEVISAFGTVGLSTGLTGDLPVSGQVILIALMLIGRVGTVTAATALALASRPRLYRLPEERPIVG